MTTKNEDLERFNRTWDKAYASGYHSGYMDAIGACWDVERRAYQAGDLAGAKLIGDLVNEIRSREAAITEHNEHLLTEARAKNS